jgi:hypothetical protein
MNLGMARMSYFQKDQHFGVLQFGFLFLALSILARGEAPTAGNDQRSNHRWTKTAPWLFLSTQEYSTDNGKNLGPSETGAAIGLCQWFR